MLRMYIHPYIHPYIHNVPVCYIHDMRDMRDVRDAYAEKEIPCRI